MKRIFLSLLFVGAISSFANAQKAELTEAKRLWAVFQISLQQASAAAPANQSAANSSVSDGPTGNFSTKSVNNSNSTFGNGGKRPVSNNGSDSGKSNPAAALSPTQRQINSIKDGLTHTEKAIAHDKTKDNPESWAYHALFSSTYAYLDSLNLENSLKYQKIASEAIAKTESLDKEGKFKDDINSAKLNIRNTIVLRALKSYNSANYNDAYKHFTDVLELTPNDTSMYMNLGLIAKMAKMYPESIENYRKYASFGGADANDYYVEMVQIATDLMKDTAQALNIIKEGLSKFPEDPGLISVETDIYIASGDIEKSQASLSKLIAKDGKNSLYQFLMGETYYKQALSMQAERNKIDIKNVKEYDAVTAKMTELIDKSLPFYKKALELDPKFAPTLEMLKQIYGFKNDIDNFNDVKKRLDALPTNQ